MDVVGGMAFFACRSPVPRGRVFLPALSEDVVLRLGLLRGHEDVFWFFFFVLCPLSLQLDVNLFVLPPRILVF